MDFLESLISAQLVQRARKAIDVADLQGHLCALVLDHGDSHRDPCFADSIDQLLARDDDEWTQLRRTVDVASVGVRLAFGASQHLRPRFVDAAKRELLRQPMPPAFCARDDVRMLAGIAAGVGATAQELVHLVDEAASDHPSASALGGWAQGLARGSRELPADIASNITRDLGSGCFDGDPINKFWLCSRLLRAKWNPNDFELSVVSVALGAARSALTAGVLDGYDASELEASMIIDALVTSPATEYRRRSAFEATLAVIDAFHASAQVLATRDGKAATFRIQDEYAAQDLFRALLLPSVGDLTPEDPASKVAGYSSRLDFTSRKEALGFELKYVRRPGDLKRIRDEILVDEATYQQHPYVRTVLVFVYDPDRHVPQADRPAFEADLSGPRSVMNRTVEYITRVR